MGVFQNAILREYCSPRNTEQHTSGKCCTTTSFIRNLFFSPNIVRVIKLLKGEVDRSVSTHWDGEKFIRFLPNSGETAWEMVVSLRENN